MRTVVPAYFDLVCEAAVAVDDFGRRVAEGEGVLQPFPCSSTVRCSSFALRVRRERRLDLGEQAVVWHQPQATNCTGERAHVGDGARANLGPKELVVPMLNNIQTACSARKGVNCCNQKHESKLTRGCSRQENCRQSKCLLKRQCHAAVGTGPARPRHLARALGPRIQLRVLLLGDGHDAPVGNLRRRVKTLRQSHGQRLP